MFEFFRLSATRRIDDFSALLLKRSARWLGACWRITQDINMAEDAVQEALLKAWDRRAQFRGDAELDTWIHRIAVNCALDLLRQKRPISLQSDQGLDAAEGNPALFADPLAALSPTDHLQGEQLIQRLTQALPGLTDLERLCFVLKHLEQYRLDEIALELQCSVDRVKQALFRGVRKLRISLAAFGDSTP